MREKLLNTIETANRIGIKPGWLTKRRVFGGGPPYLKVGRAVRYDPAAIDEWLAEHVRTSTSDPGQAPGLPRSAVRKPITTPNSAREESMS